MNAAVPANPTEIPLRSILAHMFTRVVVSSAPMHLATSFVTLPSEPPSMHLECKVQVSRLALSFKGCRLGQDKISRVGGP